VTHITKKPGWIRSMSHYNYPTVVHSTITSRPVELRSWSNSLTFMRPI